VQDPLTYAISATSGGYYPVDFNEGSFIVRGILPNKMYEVFFGEIDPKWTSESSLQPYDPPRAGIEGGKITAGNGTANFVQCQQGGEAIMMDTIQLGIASKAQFEPTARFMIAGTPLAAASKTAQGKAAKQAGCSFIKPNPNI
jgi:hypothetical protein